MSKFLPIQWINTNPYSDWPSFSLDGSQVVFTLGGALYTVDVSGANLKRLYPAEGTTGVNATRPDWSWNAESIAFTYNNSEIWTVSPDGSGAAPYCAAPPPGAYMYYPSWNQDLKSLIAVGYNKENTQAELFKLTPDSHESLTKTPYPCAGRPSVNPDGTRIAFAGNWGEYKQVQNQIWIVEPPKEPFRLEPGDPSAFQGRSPNWSPTGERIVFESTRPTPDPTGKTRLAIWIINSDGKEPWQLTDRELFSAYHAEWSRQQTQVVFAGAGQGIGIINF